MTEKHRTIHELTTGMEIRRTDGTWVRVVRIDHAASCSGAHLIDLVDDKFTMVWDDQEIMSREVAS
jgi:hypothetical protein